jgi:hypothetical protein
MYSCVERSRGECRASKTRAGDGIDLVDGAINEKAIVEHASSTSWITVTHTTVVFIVRQMLSEGFDFVVRKPPISAKERDFVKKVTANPR